MLAMWGWLLAMFAQVALLCRQLYCVALLADLETDIQNPHDWARQMNRFRSSEYLGQTLLAAALLSSRCWASGLANVLLAAFVLARLRHLGEDRCAPGDALRGAPVHRRNRLLLLGCHGALFALLTFRLVESAAHEAMRAHPGGADEARALARELLRAAAASSHGY